jgi:hypothetical protein
MAVNTLDSSSIQGSSDNNNSTIYRLTDDYSKTSQKTYRPEGTLPTP